MKITTMYLEQSTRINRPHSMSNQTEEVVLDSQPRFITAVSVAQNCQHLMA